MTNMPREHGALGIGRISSPSHTAAQCITLVAYVGEETGCEVDGVTDNLSLQVDDSTKAKSMNLS